MIMERLWDSLEKLRAKRPLVHNITNYVVMNTTANALLAIGASPIMAHSPEELNELVALADSMVINIGTLDSQWIYSMLMAAKLAKKMNKPVVLDPVGAGATKLRTETSSMILETGAVKVVKGNFGEILALAGEFGKTKGVDSAVYDAERGKELAKTVALKYGVVVGITGPVDFVSNGKETYAIKGKVDVVKNVIDRVTGLGCMVSAIVGAFIAVEDPLIGTIAGMAAFKAASIEAAKEAQTPGMFHVKLYDWLYRINGRHIENDINIERID
jgi:hydroxyethylthiazole kinase